MATKKVNLKITGFVGEGLKNYILKNIGTEGPVDVYIASPGGAVSEAQEIIVALQAAADAGREVNFYIASRACSCGSFIPTSIKGAKIWMANSSQLMFHGPWSWFEGGADGMKDQAGLLDKLRTDIKAALSSKGVKVEDEWFAEGRMKWYSAKEALDAKIADGIRNPPADLIAATGYEPVDLFSLLFGKAHSKPRQKSFDLQVAASGLEAIMVQEARQRFGLPETAEITAEITKDGVTFSGLGKEFDGVLLNFTTDSDTLPNIQWDVLSLGSDNSSIVKEGEESMADPKDTAGAGELVKALADAKAEGYQSGKKEGFTEGEAKGKAAGLEEGKALGMKEVEGSFTEAKALEKLGISAEALTFAKDNYDKARKECYDAILGVKNTPFTQDELTAMSFVNLQKTAALVTSSGEGKSDMSVLGHVTPKVTAGAPTIEGGSCPPPSDEFADEAK